MTRLRLVDALRITVHCPVAPETLAALAGGDLRALAADPVAGRLLGFIERSAELGDFGAYRGVCEVALGVECFTPTAAARPTLGTAGERAHSATVAINTYASAALEPARVEALLAALREHHPWEVPVIEVTAVRLART
ncbi:MAG: hypothetical protein JSR54_10075 [Proteobacteria bacterium]|nr:hypothetical protein [Pseudomonadota bacterium]